MEWYIGCSGFHYKHWRGSSYPDKLPQKKWFDFYTQHFGTPELNTTFYRFPQLSFLQNWYHASLGNFRFLVKAPRAITHYKKFIDVTALLTSFYETINNGLREKLGPTLFQLPPNFTYDEQRLERVVNSLNPYFNNILEFRRESWWRDNVYQTLANHPIAFCGMSRPALPYDVIQRSGSTNPTRLVLF